MSSRKNWQAWHNTSISRQLMCRPDSFPDQRSVCPSTVLSIPCWKRPIWSTGEAPDIRSRIFCKPLSGWAVPSWKEAVRRCIVVARSAETVVVICTESIIVPRNETCWLGDSMLLAKLTQSRRQPKWLRRRVLYDCQNEPVVEVVEYADSHLSQRGESRIHALRKSAGSQGQPKR